MFASRVVSTGRVNY